MSYTLKDDFSDAENEVIADLTSYFANDDWALNYIENQKVRCLHDIQAVKDLNPRKILNVGAAPYIFDALAASKDIQVTSLDLNPERHQDVIKKIGIDVLSVDIEQENSRVDLDLSPFDVIIMAQVFEHLRIDLIGTMRFLKDNMKQDSYIYLTTPNFYFFRRFVLYILKGRSGPSLVAEWRKLERYGHMGHIREYSKRDLVELFEFVGFKVVSFKRRNRSSNIRKTPKGFIPTVIFSLFERTFDVFAQDLVFVLQPEKSS